MPEAKGPISPAPSCSARPRPSPTSGPAAFPIRGLLRLRLDAGQRQRAASAASNCRWSCPTIADWDELTETIREIAPGEVWVTHGREEALVRWCELNQIRAKPLASGRLRRRGD
jgi:Cft2 family RNA processing exonuclease